jgi:magnesium chelatase subunit D
MLPFPALVGLDNARQALLLLAVDPGLGGVVLAAGVGTGKSTLMRSFSKFMREGEFVELPVGVTEDRLLGGLDLEATLSSGSRVHRSGLMARAHNGLLYADGVNLLDDSTTNHILAAFDSGIVRIEREGLSIAELSRFCLLATYDPAEGPPRRHLMDRVGLIVAPLGKAPAPARAEVVRRNRIAHQHAHQDETNGASPNQQNSDQMEDWLEEEELLQAMVLMAREALPTITITDDQVEKLIGTALVLGVEGHRADIFATRAALASAALAGRERVEDEDLERAVRYVLLPRATRAPQFEQEQEEEQPQEEPPPPPPEEEQQQEQDQGEEDDEEQPPEPPEEALAIEDMILEALEAEIPPEVLETPFMIRRSGRSGSRGSTSGNRGRHIRSVSGMPGDGRLDIIATLRAAAPWQRIRKKQRRNAKKRTRGAAAHRQHRPKIELRGDDLHVKRYRSKAGTLFCFMVDASGSMALHRMRQAKGAVNALLQQAYVHRDQVALLAFRGERADVLMPPSQSVELAKRALDVLPTGGGTPISAALLSALQVADQATSRGIHRTTLVIITDGRPNVPLNFDPTHSREQRVSDAREEVQRLAGKVRAAGIGSVVIDTQRNFISRGEAQQLAAWLGGRYFYLPQGRGEDIAHAVLAADAEDRE